MVEAIWQIRPDNLLRQNLRYLIIDLDNTLVDWGREELRPEVLAWARDCRQAGISLCICTNARRGKRIGRVAGRLGACYLAAAGKPFAKAWRQALALLRADPEETAMIGDQIFTDIWGANCFGLRSVLVRPLSRRDFFATKLPRLLEKRLLNRWREAGKDFLGEY
jgi:HAD superfamily phosphatase (TIGR01668 family)